MIDFHSHLDLYPDGITVAKEANRRNKFTLAVTTSPRAYAATSKVFNNLKNIWVALGLHPEVAEAKAAELDALIGAVNNARFIGEIGLDGSHRFRSSIKLQERIFRAVLDECRHRGGRIISIHSRGAAQLTLETLVKAGDIGAPVLHWFSGGTTELKTASRLGCWFSVGPAMLASAKGRGLVKYMPLDRILPETDGPFASENGVSLKPWEAWNICPILAELWSMPQEAVEAQLRLNLRCLLSSEARRVTLDCPRQGP